MSVGVLSRLHIFGDEDYVSVIQSGVGGGGGMHLMLALETVAGNREILLDHYARLTGDGDRQLEM